MSVLDTLQADVVAQRAAELVRPIDEPAIPSFMPAIPSFMPATAAPATKPKKKRAYDDKRLPIGNHVLVVRAYQQKRGGVYVAQLGIVQSDNPAASTLGLYEHPFFSEVSGENGDLARGRLLAFALPIAQGLGRPAADIHDPIVSQTLAEMVTGELVDVHVRASVVASSRSDANGKPYVDATWLPVPGQKKPSATETVQAPAAPKPDVNPFEGGRDTIMAHDAIKLMNGRYAWIGGSIGKVAITDGEHVEFCSAEVLRTTEATMTVWPDDEALGTWWLKHPKRRTFRRIGHWPPPKVAPANALNLWRGFAVEPKQGDWHLMLDHIINVIAAGNEELAEYVLRWTAWTLQHPGDQAEAALVLKGTEGLGKGIYANALCDIFGSHARHVTSPKHFAGSHFNAHMADCCFFFADECYWAGDKSHEGELKGMITEPTITIEPKGVNPYDVDNMLHIVIATNNDWAIPAGTDSRRFVASKVSDAHLGDRPYFKALTDELANGGLAAMLYDLLARDIGNWHPREIVETDELREQKERSLPPEVEWTLDMVRDGDRPTDIQNRAGLWVSTKEINEHAKNSNIAGMWRTKTRISKALRNIGATPKTDHNVRGWIFPTLPEARAKWCEAYFERVWEEPAATW